MTVNNIVSYSSLIGIILLIVGILSIFLTRNQKKDVNHVVAINNWDGIPPPNLTWKKVSTKCKIIPMTIQDLPKNCPICAGELVTYKSDWMSFSSDDMKRAGLKVDGQYNVQGIYCKQGHYTHLDWA